MASLALRMESAGGQAVALLDASNGSVLYQQGEISSWVLPPGSTIKPFTLQALLEAHRLKPDETFLCRGELHFAGRNLTCSHPPGLPPLDVTGALAYSCNAALLHWAQRLSPGELRAALLKAGFQISGAVSVLPAIGEGGVFTTPLGLAHAYRKLAGSAHPAVLAGLRAAVVYGTAQQASVPGLDVAGKTGTSTTASGLRAALFAGFAPSSSPQWIVAIALQGRSGGSDAAPVAADILREHSGPSYRVRVNNQILQVPVEQYVAAVLAGESSVFKHAEALKAMAVAARTYAAQQKGRHASEGFDFCNTTHCQRAEPDHIQPPLANAAHVTAGEILSWHHQTAFTPYTMSCGGCAEDVKTAWADVSAPYLRIHPDPYCGDTSWSCRIGFADIERALHQAGINCPAGLHRVTVRDRTPSGRARTLNLEGQGRGVVSAGAFRFAIGRTLGWNLVRSDWFDMNVTGSQLGLHGRGEGHGVGLCQRGAENMAAQGHTYREILGFYYPGTSSINWTRLGGQGVTVYATDSVQGRLVLTEAERILPGLRLSLARPIDIYVYPTLDAFRNHTAEPGWVAAHTQGGRIDLQPVQILQERGALHGTLLHEFLHVAVEIRAHPDLPVWFREGIVDWLAGHRANANAVRPPADSDLRQRNDRAQAEQAYRQAQSRVAALISRYGETTVVDWVSRGLPEEVKNSSANSDITNKR